MSTAPRYQHLISSAIILVLAIIVCWLSFTQQPADAFLFPQLVSLFFSVLAVWNFVRATSGLSRVGQGISLMIFRNILPGLIIALIFVFFAAREIGFYTSSFIAFLLIYTSYDPVPVTRIKGWVKRIIIAALFMAVLYGLFVVLLKVQTPRGYFF